MYLLCVFFKLECFLSAALRGQEYDRVVAQINHFENIGYGLTIKPTLTFKKEPTNELIYEMKHQEHSAEYESKFINSR